MKTQIIRLTQKLKQYGQENNLINRFSLCFPKAFVLKSEIKEAGENNKSTIASTTMDKTISKKIVSNIMNS